MGLSLFLAKLIGLYMLAVALIALLRKDNFLNVMKNIVYSEGLLAFAGTLNLLFGLAILIGHPFWEFKWPIVITLLGVLSVIQGILRVGFTTEIQKKFTVDKFERSYWFMCVVLIILGGFLTYIGFNPPVLG